MYAYFPVLCNPLHANIITISHLTRSVVKIEHFVVSVFFSNNLPSKTVWRIRAQGIPFSCCPYKASHSLPLCITLIVNQTSRQLSPKPYFFAFKSCKLFVFPNNWKTRVCRSHRQTDVFINSFLVPILMYLFSNTFILSLAYRFFVRCHYVYVTKKKYLGRNNIC